MTAARQTLPIREVLRRRRINWVDFVVGAVIIAIHYTVVRLGQSMSVNFTPGRTPVKISTDISNVPYYAARSLLRMFIALGLSTVFGRRDYRDHLSQFPPRLRPLPETHRIRSCDVRARRAQNLRAELLRRWQVKDFPTKAMLIVTHSIEEAVILADRIFVPGANPGRIRTEMTCGSRNRATATMRASELWSTRSTV